MTPRILAWSLPGIFLAAVLTACGGGGSSSPAGGTDIIDRSGRSIGTITGFSSVIVNDVTYDITGAIITVDDQPGQESDLAVGQVVLIEGLVDAGGSSGTADRITTDPVLRGAIEAIDLTASSFTVLNVTVNVVASTIFDSSILPGELASLAVGDVIEVYGYTDASGKLAATLMERSDDSEIEIRGSVTELNRDTATFTINMLTVEYGGAVLEGFDGDIAAGDLVEVEGTTLNGATLIADRVEYEASSRFDAADENTEVEVEGLVTRFASTADFDVNGIAVTTNAATSFENGAPQDIALNSKLEVEGTIDAAGVLVADSVEFELDSNLELLATVEAVDAAAGTVTMLGITCHVGSGTALIDESDANLQFFSLQNVAIGDFVKAKALDSGNSVDLTLFKRINPEDKYKLQGELAEVSDPSLFINSAQIDTSDATSYEVSEISVSKAEFFTTVEVGDRISAEGQSPSPGRLLADSIERD